MTIDPHALIAGSSLAAVVSDPSQPDNPIISCNDAFLRLTGYAREEIIGRNCRFLQGAETERGQAAILRRAIERRQAAMAEFVNYRKDGTAFRNAVMIAPLYGDDGELRWFIGSQVAVEPQDAAAADRARARIRRLSPPQFQILAALARGRMNKQIAYELKLTERTVKMHRAAMLAALDVRTVAEAIRIAVEAGL